MPADTVCGHSLSDGSVLARIDQFPVADPFTVVFVAAGAAAVLVVTGAGEGDGARRISDGMGTVVGGC
ncbi:MAG: hypothetical protein WBF79_05090, partial [Rhodococcus sp. (in: high G+C Gram-positive bacteria)]